MRIHVIVFSVLLALVACSEQKLSYPQRTMPESVKQDQAGLAWAQRTFLDKCAYCHGHENEGRGPRADFFDPPAPDFYERQYKEADPAYLYWRIAEGKTVEPFLSRGSVMPAWGPHFSEKETWLMVYYLIQRAGGK